MQRLGAGRMLQLHKLSRLEHQDNVGDLCHLPRVDVERERIDRVADFVETVIVDLARALIMQLFLEFVPPGFPVGQGAASKHDGAGGLPHGRMLLPLPSKLGVRCAAI